MFSNVSTFRKTTARGNITSNFPRSKHCTVDDSHRLRGPFELCRSVRLFPIRFSSAPLFYTEPRLKRANGGGNCSQSGKCHGVV